MKKSALMKNDYPAKFINKVKNKMENSQINRNYQQNDKKYAVAPYIQNVSERVAKILSPFNIYLASKPNNKLRNRLCNFKYKRLKTDEAGVVYKLNCNDCPSSYIGETGRLPKERTNEYKKDIEKKKPNSNVYMHVQSTAGHTFDFDGVEIMIKSNNKYVRKRLEGIHTSKESNTLNRAWEVNPIYNNIL